MAEIKKEDKDSLIEYWEGQIDLMSSPHWDEFVKETMEQIKAVSNINSISDNAQLNHAKGQLLVYNAIVTRKETASEVLDHINSMDVE